MKSQVLILFQNKDIIAVNKPEGISIHNIEESDNLIQILVAQLNISTLYPIHRLDKETSGVQLFALHEKAAKIYAEEFQQRSVIKKYVGILRGSLSQVEGTWDLPLTDKAEGRKNPQGLSRDRIDCETQFKVLGSTKYFTLCEFNLITGRQHQIRKHTALLKHALVGDHRYGDKNYNDKIAQIYGLDRMFLHCSYVKIKELEFNAPVPKDFENLIS